MVPLKNAKTPKISFGNDAVFEKQIGNLPKITDDSKEVRQYHFLKYLLIT